MSKLCEYCDRGYLKAASRSHSNIKTLKRQHVNLQVKTVGGKKLKLCTRCIKTLAKNKA